MRVFMLKPVQVTALREAALPRAPGHAPAAGARASRRARESGDRADAGAATARGAGGTGGAGGARPVAVRAAVEREAPAAATRVATRALRFITSQRGGAERAGRGGAGVPAHAAPQAGGGGTGSVAGARLRGDPCFARERRQAWGARGAVGAWGSGPPCRRCAW